MNLNSFKNRFKNEWITQENCFDEEALKFAEDFGKHLCALNDNGRAGFEALTTSQIRNFFGEVQRIQAKVAKGGFEGNKISFLLLKPKLAYAEARALAKQRHSRLKDFRTIMDLAHSAVVNSSEPQVAFQRFVDLLEAILAYHKGYGGRD